MEKFKTYWRENKSIWLYILALFIATRLILSLIGWVSMTYLPQQATEDWKNTSLETEHPYLQMWAVWDSKWYLMIAEKGYSDAMPFNVSEYSTIGFFPLYPITISALQLIIHDYLLAGWLLSNLFLLLSAYLLYKLVGLDHDASTAKRSLWYLFLFPSAYIFSAIYPESMLLCAWLACALLAKKRSWASAGVVGFLAALIKPSGFFIAIPLVLIYLFNDKKLSEFFSKKNPFAGIRIRSNIIFTMLPFLGLLAWGYANYLMTGDFLAYSHVQLTSWDHRFMMPFTALYQNMSYGPDYLFNSLSTIAILLLAFFGYKRIPFSYWIFAMMILLFNPITGTVMGSWRYSASAFPILIILASWGKNETADRAIMTSMAILQGCLFVLWIAGFWFTS